MSWKDIGKTIASYAPLLGGVIGGHAGAGVGSLIASLFGVDDDDPDAVMKAIKTDPEAEIKLKEFELSHKVELEKLKLEETRIYIGDTQNAREMYIAHNGQADKIAANIINYNAVIVAIVALAQIIAISQFELTDSALVIIGNVCGWIIKGMLDERLQVCGFYFGSSIGSKSKK